MAYQTLVRSQLEYASFFPKTIIDWNHLEESVVRAEIVRCFKDEQSAEPQMVGTGQLVSLHCCNS